MGYAIARNGDAITEKSVSNHIDIRRWIPPSGSVGNGDYSSGYYSYSKTSAIISGNIKATSGAVYVNGKLACVRGNSTSENDSYTLPTGYEYVSGSHSGESGSISSGSSTVRIGGVAVARKGDSITTHANESTTINEGSSNVFVG